MPHVAFVPFTGLRVRESEMLELGMTLPGLGQRAQALDGLPALGLLTLAGMTGQDWTCSYHPSSASGSLIDDVLMTDPAVVAVSALTASAIEAYTFCDAVRAQHVPTVLGGLHATVLPDEAARHSTAVCVGDGESSWPQILSDASRRSLKPFYRPTNPYTLTDSPVPRFDLLGQRPSPQRWTFQTQRGCPWACEFCGASRLLGPARFKSIPQVRRELAEIRGLDDSPWIELADDNTLAGRENPIEFLEAIESAGVKYFTESDWRIGVEPELVRALASSGCVQVLVGFESLAFRYPGMGKKLAELDRMCEAIDVIHDAGIVVNGCFILGADGETNESLDRLVEFINNSSLAEVQLTLQTPFPGTGLYRRLQKPGRLLTKRDWSFYTLFDVVFQPDRLSVEELEAGFRRVMSSVFSDEDAKRRSLLRRRIWRRHPRMKNLRA